MRIAVTGKHGQIARALAEHASRDVDIVFAARPQFDLTRPGSALQTLRALEGDVIVNAAAYTAVDLAEANRDAAFAANEHGAHALAEAATILGTPLIHLSSDYVFDGRKGAAYVETDQPAPLNVYGESKWAGERAVAAAQPFSVILRTSWIYGPHGRNFVRTMLSLARDCDEVSVVNDQRGRPAAAHDIAGALISIARTLAERPTDIALHGVFHLGGASEATSWADFAEAIFAASAQKGGPSARVKPISSEAFGAPAARPAYSILNGAKLHAAYGVSLPAWDASLVACVDRILHEGAP